MSASATFQFEADFAGSLRCIPMCVRMKLDLCGIKLTLSQWSRLSAADRRWLAERPCESQTEASELARELAALVGLRTSQAVLHIALDLAPGWADSGRVPDCVKAKTGALGLSSPSSRQWGALTMLQRFALTKLARDGHESANFLPAMREFHLLDEAAVQPSEPRNGSMSPSEN